LGLPSPPLKKKEEREGEWIGGERKYGRIICHETATVVAHAKRMGENGRSSDLNGQYGQFWLCVEKKVRDLEERESFSRFRNFLALKIGQDVRWKASGPAFHHPYLGGK